MCRSLATSASKGRLSLFASSDTVINQFPGRCDVRAGLWPGPIWTPNRRRHAQMLRKIAIAEPVRHAGIGLRSTETNSLSLLASRLAQPEADFWFYAG